LTVDYSWGYTMPCKKHYSYTWTKGYGSDRLNAGKPLAVGGDPEVRHGIVLTADYIAKRYGVKTGMALWH